MTWSNCLIVVVGGALGTLARYGVSSLAQPISTRLPWDTILINVAASFVIGFFTTLTLAEGKYPAPEAARLFVVVGLCGGFTTFSAFSLQTLDLMRAGALVRAGVTVLAFLLLSLAAVAAGHLLAAGLNRGAARAALAAVEKTA